MKIKTSELTGAALDWAVTKAQGFKFGHWHINNANAFSTDWAHGGPIIEREGITIQFDKRTPRWQAYAGRKTGGFGPTPLVAAMRCFVKSKLGDEVDVPEELLK